MRHTSPCVSLAVRRAPALTALLLAGCTRLRSDDDESGDRELTVLAAASLTDVFEDLADRVRGRRTTARR